MENVEIVVKGKRWRLPMMVVVGAVLGLVGLLIGLAETKGCPIGGFAGLIIGLLIAALIRVVMG